jgi:hypothetical protein
MPVGGSPIWPTRSAGASPFCHRSRSSNGRQRQKRPHRPFPRVAEKVNRLTPVPFAGTVVVPVQIMASRPLPIKASGRQDRHQPGWSCAAGEPAGYRRRSGQGGGNHDGGNRLATKNARANGNKAAPVNRVGSSAKKRRWRRRENWMKPYHLSPGQTYVPGGEKWSPTSAFPNSKPAAKPRPRSWGHGRQRCEWCKDFGWKETMPQVARVAQAIGFTQTHQVTGERFQWVRVGGEQAKRRSRAATGSCIASNAPTPSGVEEVRHLTGLDVAPAFFQQRGG